jgi:predicted dehydrogenase
MPERTTVTARTKAQERTGRAEDRRADDGHRSQLPRLGFVGLGWIGRLRLQAVAEARAAAVAALCEPVRQRLQDAAEAHADVATFRDAEEALAAADALELDGVVIATPNALHVAQARAALDRGLAVFVQKPLGTGAGEVQALIEHARSADRRLGVDYTYRHLDAAHGARELVRRGALGEVFFVEAAFHNAYGPDKEWCFDPEVAGGGALMDLGVHLVDLSLWLTDGSRVEGVRGWTRDLPGHRGIDGFSAVEYRIRAGPSVRVAASWHAHAGRDCAFEVTLHGTEGSAVLRNVEGSFYDFELCLRRARSEEVVARDERRWMDRAIVAWARDLADDPGYDPSVEASLEVARVVDRVYGRP